MLVDFANKILSLGIIAGQIFLIWALLYFIFFRKSKNIIATFISKHGLLLAFYVALISVIGSLFYSEFAGFQPCNLCWFQRIFIYPEVILLGLALMKKDLHIIDYALSLSFIGFLISLYHNYIYYYNGGLIVFCQFSGVSCTKLYVFEFGYITIPLMAATAFLLIIIFLLFKKYERVIQ